MSNFWTDSRQVRELTYTLTYASTTSAKKFTLPANAQIVDIIVNVQTAFVGGTNKYIRVGISSDASYLVTDTSVGSAGRVALTTALVRPGYKPTALTDIYAYVRSDDSTLTAGSLTLTFLVAMQEDVSF